MKKTVILFFSTFVCYSLVAQEPEVRVKSADAPSAQITPGTEAGAASASKPVRHKRRRKKAVPASNPAPAPAPAPEKRTFLQRLFNIHPKTKTPPSSAPSSQKKTGVPATKPTPSRKVKGKPEATPAPSPSSKTKTKTKMHAAPGATETPATAPKKKKTKPAPEKNANAEGETGEQPSNMKQPVPIIPPPNNSTREDAPKFEDLAAQDVNEKARLSEVQSKALEDKQVRSLQEKADNAASDEEQIKASKQYYKALYNKMRHLDESLKGRIDRIEAATMKRLEQKQPGGGNQAQ